MALELFNEILSDRRHYRRNMSRIFGGSGSILILYSTRKPVVLFKEVGTHGLAIYNGYRIRLVPLCLCSGPYPD